ncbi:MAG: NAD(P)-dependent oxidoreductase [Candidatus Marinimicrobia bacterium]|nr:NAD(P)-dependent oxidoreductase [Candidatus Neomarinimicrobiota bacterium]
MKKVYVAGCGGMLGEAIYHVFKDAYELKCTDIDVNEDWLSYCDFRDLEQYSADVNDFKPDILFHLGAYTDLEYCELHTEGAYLTNTISVENAVQIANKLGIPVLYISTAGIFNGQKEWYDDWDRPDPLGHYARSKYLGERHVQLHAPRHLIFRAGWMMGGGPRKDKKFIQKLMKQIKEGATELFIVDDKLGTPTYTFDFAQNVKLVLEQELWGLYNLVCEGVTDRLEVATALVSTLGLHDKIKINRVSSDHFKEDYFAPRPPSERLINRKLNLRNLNIMRPWREALAVYIQRDYQDYL